MIFYERYHNRYLFLFSIFNIFKIDIKEYIYLENKFRRASIRERKLLSQFFDRHFPRSIFVPTPDSSYDRQDGEVCIEGISFIVEAKVRNKNYDTLLLEQQKYVSLMTLSKEKGTDVLYINFCQDGVYVWNLNCLEEISWQYKECPRHTVDDDNDYITKSVTMLDKGSSSFFHFKEKFDDRAILETIRQKYLSN